MSIFKISRGANIGFFIKCLSSLFVFLQTIGPPSVESFSSVQQQVEEHVFGGQVHILEAGRSNPEILLLVHGLGDEAGRVWDDLLPDLSLKYHVVVPDLPGFGHSSKGNFLYSPSAYATFLDWLIKSLPDKPVYLVGHSLGGGIALVYAARYGSNLKRLILVDTVGLLHHVTVSQNFVRQQLEIDLPLLSSSIESSLERATNLILEKTSRLPLDPDRLLFSENMREKFLGGDPSRIAGLALVQTDYSLVPAKISAPTWLLWGEKDQIASLRTSKALFWNLPTAELKILPETGHIPMQDDPQQFLSILKQALQQEPDLRRPLLLKPYERIGICNNEQNQIFEGFYSAIRIKDCKNVMIKNVTTQKMEITDSEVFVEFASIQGGNNSPAIHLQRSRLTMTGVDIHADVGILTDQSRLDLAGVRFFSSTAAIEGVGNRSSLVFSSSTKHSNGSIRALHLSQSLNPGESL